MYLLKMMNIPDLEIGAMLREVRRIYFVEYTNFQISNVYVFDYNGNSIDQFSNIANGIDLITDTDTGFHYCNVSRTKVVEYDSHMNPTAEFPLDNPGQYISIKMSFQNENIFVGNHANSQLYKYSKSGELIRTFSAHNGNFNGTWFASYFTGDREKIFLVLGDKIDVVGSEGQLLTSYIDPSYTSLSRLSRDENGNLYILNFCFNSKWNSHQVKKYLILRKYDFSHIVKVGVLLYTVPDGTGKGEEKDFFYIRCAPLFYRR